MPHLISIFFKLLTDKKQQDYIFYYIFIYCCISVKNFNFKYLNMSYLNTNVFNLLDFSLFNYKKK